MSESRATVVVIGNKPAQSERRVAVDRREPVSNETHGPDFAFLANSIPQLVWTSDAEGFCDYFNQRWFDYTGSTFEQSAGNGWQYVIHPEDLDAVSHAWKQANRTGQECVVEHRLRHRSGEYRWNLMKAMPMRAMDGTITRWFGTCTDIQEQKDAASLQQQRTREVAKAKVRSHLAHEINNPLNATMNLLYLAQIFPKRAHGFVEAAETEVRKIAEITRRILAER
jgi:PAS domain S-box-containing protein